MSDEFGDRMKGYESLETGARFMPYLPIYVRIDGRNFSKFTRYFERPFDREFSEAMQETTRHIVLETNAVAAYTQSDEINLLMMQNTMHSQMYFGGKKFKIISVLAAQASVFFNSLCKPEWLENNPLPTFDCRAFQLPNRTEAANAFLWREQDASKNAISMAARSMFPHKQLQGKSSQEMKEMMFHEHGVTFQNYPGEFRRGVFFVRREEERALDWSEREQIPKPWRPAEGQVVMLNRVERIVLPDRFSTVTNREEFLFEGAEPIYARKGGGIIY